MKVRKSNSGFTLVEIMIVVAIIGLLAAIAVPNFIQARVTSRQNTCINNLRQLQAAKDQFVLENNQVDAFNGWAAGNLDAYIRGGEANLVCPLDAAQTFVTSYTTAAANAVPLCLNDPGGANAHVLP